ncbi:MAG TPA: hypothetical protein VM204_03930 [Gaiellaceae bacterium]|nr:hypothetical protein [Gaiellaceae bacterium]
MSENEPTTQSSEDPVESGALEDDDLDAQQGKGYGADEGERDAALDE